MSKSIQTTNNSTTSVIEQEEFWVERLENLQPLTIPYAKQTISPAQQEFKELVMSVPDELMSNLRKFFPDWQGADILLVAYVSYMARMNEDASFDIGFADTNLAHEVANLEGVEGISYTLSH